MFEALGGEEQSPRPGKGEHPLAHRDTGEDVVDQMGRAVDHASCTARGTKSSSSTAEGHDVLVGAGRALDAKKTSFEPTTLKIVVELLAHE